MHFSDKSRYVGNWVQDKCHGKGIHYESNGNSYEGDFKNDS
jgi:hypothetical protein